jgi:excisionase family DNA binding protein
VRGKAKSISEQELQIKILDTVNRALQIQRLAVAPRTKLSTKQVAKILHRKPSNIYQMAQFGKLPSYKEGGKVVFYEDEILKLKKREVVNG